MAKPWWWGSTEGISDQVLAPWTPIEVVAEVGKLSLRPWGRTYEFEDALFPTAVEATGQALLAEPVRLYALAGGREQRWQTGPLDVMASSGARVAWRQEAQGEDLSIVARATLDFDGMLRLDWTVRPRRPLRLDSLTLEVPLRAQVARYLYFYPGRWGGTYNATALPPSGTAMAFHPFIWLGNEERGFSWFCESDHNWTATDPESAIEIRHEGDTVVLHLDMIGNPLDLMPGAQAVPPDRALDACEGPIGELSYSFGFQATPVRQNAEDAWDFRLSHAGDYGIESMPPDFATLTYAANGNVTLDRGTLEMWVAPQFGLSHNHGLTRNLVSLELPGTGSMRWFWAEDDRRLHLRLEQSDQAPIVLTASADWHRGDWHHIALTWDETLRLYVDGKLEGEAAHQGLLAGSLADTLLVLGGPLCGFVVDEIRSSWVARSPAEIAATAEGTAPHSVEDVHTLLLDRLDHPYDPGNIEHLDSLGTFTRPHIAGLRPGGQAGRDRARYTNGWTGAGLIDGSARFVGGKFGYGLQLGSLEEPILDRLVEHGVRGVCFHEHWTDWQSYPYTDRYAHELRSLVSGCHQRGVQLLLYYGFDFSALAPEFEEYQDKCLVKPHHGGRLYTCTPAPQQRTFTVCLNSVWQDHLVAGIARMMDEFNIDGVYLDSTAHPFACANLAHGCGYVRGDGSVVPTYPIFAVRNALRRIYTVVKSRKPEGQVNVHQSTCMTIPTIAWATSLWDGEQFGHIEPGPHALSVLPLEAFRTEFMGHQWGTPQEFLCYERPYTFSQALAVTLLHDVPVRPIGAGPNLELMGRLWGVMDAFGRKDAEWLPYWRNGEYVSIKPHGAFASLYRSYGNGVLAVISNLGRKPAKVQANFSLNRLGLEGSATDAMSGQALALAAGSLELAMQPMEWRLIWLK